MLGYGIALLNGPEAGPCEAPAICVCSVPFELPKNKRQILHAYKEAKARCSAGGHVVVPA